jgi:hypothetical protein
MRQLATVLVILAGVGCSAADPTAPATSMGAAPPATVQADRGTPAEAAAMLEQAVAHYERVGRDQALADFTAKAPPFADRDLYVFCYGPDRRVSAHGADPSYIGADIDQLRDVNGKPFAIEIWDVAARPEGGTVDYMWANPATAEQESKVSFVRRVGEDVCAVGAYEQ